jgi:hypothetical protein
MSLIITSEGFIICESLALNKDSSFFPDFVIVIIEFVKDSSAFSIDANDTFVSIALYL